MEKDTAAERYLTRETLQIYLFQDNIFLKIAQLQDFFFFGVKIPNCLSFFLDKLML